MNHFLSFIPTTAVEFTKRTNKYCYQGRYPEKGYDSIEEAKNACEIDTICGKVYDRSCDDNGPFYLCPKSSIEYGSQSSCLYEKIQKGKWLSIFG